MKVILRFDEPFWEGLVPSGAGSEEDHSGLGFLHSRDPFFPVWWTGLPVQTPILTAWAGGSPAIRLSGMAQEVQVHHAVESLGRLLGIPREDIECHLEAWYAHDWQADPFSRGG